MDRASLRELRGQWWLAVCAEHSRGNLYRGRGCWFAENVPGTDDCEGEIEGAHWIKRQRVEEEVARMVGVSKTQIKHFDRIVAPELRAQVESVLLAAWDPRNGVPACEKHHRRFDGHRVDAANELIVWRHEVPAPVESFCLDWGLETALEDRNPTIGGGI